MTVKFGLVRGIKVPERGYRRGYFRLGQPDSAAAVKACAVVQNVQRSLEYWEVLNFARASTCANAQDERGNRSLAA
jgi:hypothetical protein